MQVAGFSTDGGSLRDEIWGWGYEDSKLFVHRSIPSDPYKPFIGHTPSPKGIPYYHTVLEALADGWKLLAPPERCEWDKEHADANDMQPNERIYYTWWLTRET